MNVQLEAADNKGFLRPFWLKFLLERPKANNVFSNYHNDVAINTERQKLHTLLPFLLAR
ncbi:MAG: hypothetical protein IPM39_18685 [Chloroflexi bacterium]|nr:hypothetical protein [Chloroflexota bacterium]